MTKHDILVAALGYYENQLQLIEDKITQLKTQLGVGGRPLRTVSPVTTRERISKKMKKRWREKKKAA